MKELKKYLFAIWSILLVVGGVLIGSKLSKKEYNLTVKRTKAKRGGKVVVSPSMEITDTKTEVRKKVRKRKIFKKR